jgi:hypothetical protein
MPEAGGATVRIVHTESLGPLVSFRNAGMSTLSPWMVAAPIVASEVRPGRGRDVAVYSSGEDSSLLL